VVVGHGAAVGEQFAVVVEQDDAVAQQAPTLFGVAADDGREVTRLAGGVGAGRYVVTPGASIRSVSRRGDRNYVPCWSDYEFDNSVPGLKRSPVTPVTRSPDGVGR
jgi:hypothetical protein